MGNCIQGAQHALLAPAVPGDQAGPAGDHAQQPSQPAERLPSRVATSRAQGPAAGLPLRPPRPDAAGAASGEPPMALPSPGHSAAENVIYAVPIYEDDRPPGMPFAEATLDPHMPPELPELPDVQDLLNLFANLPIVGMSELIPLAPPPTRSRGDEIGTSRSALGAVPLRSQDLPALAENRTSAQELNPAPVMNPSARAAEIIESFDRRFPLTDASNPELHLGVDIRLREGMAAQLATYEAMIAELNGSPELAESARLRFEEIRRAIPVHLAALRLDEDSSRSGSEN